MKMDNMVKVNNKDTNDVIGIAQLQDRYIDSKIVPRSALCAAEVSCLVSAELLRLSLVDWKRALMFQNDLLFYEMMKIW